MRCPKHNGGDICEVDELHYGTVCYTVQKSDRELVEKYGAGVKIVYRLLCATHSVVFSSEEYDGNGWKSCRCERCTEKTDDFQQSIANQRVPRWEPKQMPDVQESLGVPF